MTVRLPAKLAGVLLASTATSLGGFTVLLTRLIIDQTDSLSLAMIRYGMAAAFLAAVLFATMRFPRMSRHDMLRLTLYGIIMFSGFPYFMTRAL